MTKERQVAKILCASSLLVVSCVASTSQGTASESGASEAASSSGFSASSSSEQTSFGLEDEGTGTADTGSQELTTVEQAATLACSALEMTTATSIPYGRGPYLDNGFRIGSDFPYRFQMDSSSPDIGWVDGDYTCYDVGPPQDTEEEWWFAANDWLEPDGQIHVYMATRAIDDVIYYGGNETFEDVPGSPVTDSISHDVSAVCPELPWIWLPDIADHPENAERICMRHTEAVAEAVFVRVP